MKQKIKIPNDAEIILTDQTAAANNIYLPIENNSVTESTKPQYSLSSLDRIKKGKTGSTAEKMNSAIIKAQWGQQS